VPFTTRIEGYLVHPTRHLGSPPSRQSLHRRQQRVQVSASPTAPCCLTQDPICGYQIGSKYPVVRVKQDRTACAPAASPADASCERGAFVVPNRQRLCAAAASGFHLCRRLRFRRPAGESTTRATPQPQEVCPSASAPPVTVSIQGSGRNRIWLMTKIRNT
jgi:hypothetical protein